MKTPLIIAAFCCLFVSTSAQSEFEEPLIRSLFGRGDNMHHSGWGALTSTYTNILDQEALLVGVRGGWLIDHRLTIGIAGSGLVTNIENQAFDDHLVDQGTPGKYKARFQTGYGGLLIEPIIWYSSPIHISLPIVIGAGGATYTTNYWHEEFESRPYPFYGQASAFFVFEPGVDLELNMVSFMRIGLGASYRYTSDLDLAATPIDALNGWNASFSLKFGSF